MTTFKRISFTSLALFLVVAGAAAHHLYETHLSSGYAPILRAAMDPHAPFAEMGSYIHDARVAVRTDKDRETQVKLDRLQDISSGHALDVACGSTTTLLAEKLPDLELAKGFGAILKCQQAKQGAMFAEEGALYKELRATAGIR